jgi:integrase
MASISRTKSGHWKVHYRDPARRQRSKTFPKKSDADRYSNTVETDKLRGDWTDPQLARTRLGDWWEQHTATRLHLRESTRARNESVGRKMVLPTFGGMQLGAIRPVAVRQWISELLKAGYAPATIRKAYQLLSSALEAAATEGLIPRSPARDISLPRQSQPEMRFLTPQEVVSLAEAIDPRYRVMVYTAAYTGLRLGEITALRRQDVNFLRRHLRVERTLTEVQGELRFADPKTEASRRTIQLPEFLVNLLAAHIAEYPDPSGLIFSAAEGGPIRQTNFRHRFWDPAVQASVGKPCRFHDLRHTHAALLIAQGEHPKVIQARLGHASISTTLNVYGHLFEGLDEAAAKRLEQVYVDSRVDTLLSPARA